jgi:hypothetical protein
MLDPDVDAIERAWRVMLNVVVNYAEYSRATERLGADAVDQAAIDADRAALKSDVQAWFSPTTGRNPDWERGWQRAGSGFPTYTDLSVPSVNRAK